LILVSAWRLLAESMHVLMEGVPAQVSLENVLLDLDDIPGVRRVHDLHIWTLSSGQIALSAHLELDSFEDWDRILQVSRAHLDKHHGIRHVTCRPNLARVNFYKDFT
jgi:cobalt-zinc-cadmium efflux system protein